MRSLHIHWYACIDVKAISLRYQRACCFTYFQLFITSDLKSDLFRTAATVLICMSADYVKASKLERMKNKVM